MGEPLMAFLFVGTTNKTVQNTVTETTLFPAAGGTLVIPANQVVAGSLLRITIQGAFITDAIPPTLRFRVRLTGGASVVVGDTTARALAFITVDSLFSLVFEIRTDTLGATGIINACGRVVVPTATVTAPEFWSLRTGSGHVIDSTVDQTLDVTAAWGTANANNSIRSEIAVVEITGPV